jgi:polysaccharide deacetylase family protein (PEP-CTERM system associated)
MTNPVANGVTFTLDVEDYVADGTAPRAPRVTRDIVAFLARREVRGTFFVVGELAAQAPDLVREIAAAGHEVALHAYRHEPLTRLTRDAFREDTKRGKALLEDLIGAEVAGFRAPTFSLVPSTAWATDILTELGFRYSSSVLPARSPLFGWPGQPRVPTRWPSGLFELPCPVTFIGPLANPYLGGVYFRVLPWTAVRYGMRHALPGELLWTYCHPYDFDPDEPFALRPGLGRAKSRLLWLNRRRMFERIGRLFDLGTASPLVERIPTL